MIIATKTNDDGGNNIIPLFSYPIEYNPVPSAASPNTGNPNKLPEPNNSLKNATTIKTQPYPIAFPNPSSAEAPGLLPNANSF